MICIDRDPTQDKMTNNCCCATEQPRPRYFSTRMSVPCQFFNNNNNNNNNGQSTRNKQGVTVATATANHSSMGIPNIATGCYISQFTYNLLKFLFPPPPLLRNFVVSLDPLLGILHRINLSALCVQQGKLRICDPLITRISTAICQPVCRILEKCHEFHTSPHSNQRDPRDSFKVLNSYRPCPISEDIDIAFCWGTSSRCCTKNQRQQLHGDNYVAVLNGR